MIQYDFKSRIKQGSTLLVGEGNLSFSVSLIKSLKIFHSITSSTYEEEHELSRTTRINSIILKQEGLRIMHGVDATCLHNIFCLSTFYTIIFQFPHSGSRDWLKGINANYLLVKKFIISASQILRKNGVIIITIVDSEFYNKMFQFEKLTKDLKIKTLKKFLFDPNSYPNYEHSMTHKENSAIKDYSKFATYEFQL